MAYPHDNPEAAGYYKDNWLFGHEILTDEGPTTTQRYMALIPLGTSATLTYFNTLDGETIGAQAFPFGTVIKGHLATVTVSGSCIAVKADPSIVDLNAPA